MNIEEKLYKMVLEKLINWTQNCFDVVFIFLNVLWFLGEFDEFFKIIFLFFSIF